MLCKLHLSSARLAADPAAADVADVVDDNAAVYLDDSVALCGAL